MSNNGQYDCCEDEEDEEDLTQACSDGTFHNNLSDQDRAEISSNLSLDEAETFLNQCTLPLPQ